MKFQVMIKQELLNQQFLVPINFQRAKG